MARSVSPATIVICATLPQQLRSERCDVLLRGAGSLPVPVTWVAALDRREGGEFCLHSKILTMCP